MAKKIQTVEDYLASLPEDRRELVEAIRQTILENLGEGFEEGLQYGMIGYFVPHSVYPDGYHCDPSEPVPFAGIGNQKGHVGIYLFCIYVDQKVQEQFVAAWQKTGKKLDMGKSCVRVKKLDDVPLPVLGRTIRKIKLQKFLDAYTSSIPASKRKKK